MKTEQFIFSWLAHRMSDFGISILDRNEFGKKPYTLQGVRKVVKEILDKLDKYIEESENETSRM